MGDSGRVLGENVFSFGTPVSLGIFGGTLDRALLNFQGGPDRDHFDRTAEGGSPPAAKPRLPGREGERLVGHERAPRAPSGHQATVRVQTRRKIEGDPQGRGSPAVGCPGADALPRVPGPQPTQEPPNGASPELPPEAGSEQGVDEHTGPRRRPFGLPLRHPRTTDGRLHATPFPLLSPSRPLDLAVEDDHRDREGDHDAGHDGGVTPQAPRRHGGDHPNPPSQAVEMPRHDPPVATVVPASAQNLHPGSTPSTSRRRDRRRNRSGGARARVLHQNDPGNPVLFHRDAIQGPGLLPRQLDHDPMVAKPFPQHGSHGPAAMPPRNPRAPHLFSWVTAVLLASPLAGGCGPGAPDSEGGVENPKVLNSPSPDSGDTLESTVLEATVQPVQGLFRNRSVALIVTDSMDARHLGCYGQVRETSPYLDALASMGVRFLDASSQTSWTLPSVASLFTSVDQEHHGLRFLEDQLGTHHGTLAEAFSRAGYRTVAIFQNPLLPETTGLHRGFDEVSVLGWENAGAEEALDQAIETWTEDSDSAAPLFLYVHWVPPHMPYQPPAPFRDRFVASDSSGIVGSVAEARRIHRAQLEPGDPEVLALLARYHEHVAFADDLVGRLHHGLRQAQGEEPFLFVHTSDHGEAFLQHGQQGHNTSVHREMTHVPWILWGAGLPRGLEVEAPVSLLDVGPTLRDLCAIPQAEVDGSMARGEGNPGQRGRSRAEALEPGNARDGESRAPEEPERFFSSSRYRLEEHDFEAALREGDTKLIWSASRNRVALYRLDRDPNETRDVSAEYPERAERMAADLEAWYRDRGVRGVDANHGSRSDPRILSALEALGYLEDPPEPR